MTPSPNFNDSKRRINSPLADKLGGGVKVLKVLGSLWLAITLIAGLAVILTVSTVLESVHGTSFAQKHFYASRWFDLFLSLLWVNIFCSTWTRWPFQKKHIGFVITHVGILTLLVGALLSRTLGAEGQMALFEGQAKGNIELETPSIDPTLDPVTEGSLADPVNLAVCATLSGEAMNVHETFTLVERHPDNPHSFFTDIGPAHFELKTDKAGNSKGPILKITQKAPAESWDISLNEAADEVPLGQSGLTVAGIRYTSHAKIVDNRITEAPGDANFNPAVKFDVRDARGRIERHTRFYLFPNFDSLRGGRSADIFGLDVQLIDPALPPETGAPSPAFIFLAKPDGKWSYRIISSKNAPIQGPLEIGKKIQTGWMDMTVDIHKTYQRAKAYQAPKPQSIPVPFKLLLTDFRKVDYPGTSNAASFESDVVLHDPEDRITLEKTIQMNKPLDYKGWRIFQSSYMQDERFGEGSVFTVAKNPGIALIYGSAPIIFLGVILLFYFHRFFDDKVK